MKSNQNPGQKVTLICTVRNEADSIQDFLESIARQTRRPEEIVIVDGGSTDGTIELIENSKGDLPINLISRPGTNIPTGRNIAIESTKSDIVACTDAGCRLSESWLEEIVKPIEESHDVDVVSGWYEDDPRTFFEASLAAMTYPKLRTFIENPEAFLPSSRSICFRKNSWREAGGYPEWLETAEDTLFDIRLKIIGKKFAFAPRAFVYWRPRKNLAEAFRQRFLYSKGNGRARIFGSRRIPITLAIYLSGILLLGTSAFLGVVIPTTLVLALGFMAYTSYFSRGWITRKFPVGFFWCITIRFVDDLALLVGFARGLLERDHLEIDEKSGRARA